MKETNKGDVKSICAKEPKHASQKVVKAQANLKWLWTVYYRLFWLHTNIYRWFSQFDSNALTGFMISLFLAAPAPRRPRTWNLMGISVRSGFFWFFLLFGKKLFFIQKLRFLINKLFRNVSLTSRVIGLIPLRYAKLQC